MRSEPDKITVVQNIQVDPDKAAMEAFRHKLQELQKETYQVKINEFAIPNLSSSIIKIEEQRPLLLDIPELVLIGEEVPIDNSDICCCSCAIL